MYHSINLKGCFCIYYININDVAYLIDSTLRKSVKSSNGFETDGKKRGVILLKKFDIDQFLDGVYNPTDDIHHLIDIIEIDDLLERTK